MGLFGGSKSSNTTNVDSNTGQSNISGNGNLALSGLKGSSVVLSDHGAVNGALKMVQDAAEGAFGFAGEAVEINAAVTEDALDFGRDAYQDALDFGSESFDKALDFSREALTVGERGSLTALEVASNISRDSENVTNQEAVKYMALAMAAVAVGLAIRGRI